MPEIVTDSHTDLASSLRLVVTRTARRLRQEADSGLSPSLTAALATIERRGPITPSELADIEHVQRPTATRLVARLEEEGLVERARDPSDGRACLVSPSGHGRAALGEIRGRKTAYLAQRLEALGDEDVETLRSAAAVLERLLEADERR